MATQTNCPFLYISIYLYVHVYMYLYAHMCTCVYICNLCGHTTPEETPAVHLCSHSTPKGSWALCSWPYYTQRVLAFVFVAIVHLEGPGVCPSVRPQYTWGLGSVRVCGPRTPEWAWAFCLCGFHIASERAWAPCLCVLPHCSQKGRGRVSV
jgi:hypothetical protein